MSGKKWTEKELEFLRENYGRIIFSKLKEIIHGRTGDSIRKKANELGLTFSKKTWRKSDREFVFNNMDTMSYSEISHELDRDVRSIRRLIGDFRITLQMEADVDLSVIEKGVPLGAPKAVEHRILLKNMEVGESYVYPSSERATLNNQLKYFPNRIYRTVKNDELTRRVFRIS